MSEKSTNRDKKSESKVCSERPVSTECNLIGEEEFSEKDRATAYNVHQEVDELNNNPRDTDL